MQLQQDAAKVATISPNFIPMGVMGHSILQVSTFEVPQFKPFLPSDAPF